MAKADAPLLSLQARGHVRRSIIFNVSRWGQSVKRCPKFAKGQKSGRYVGESLDGFGTAYFGTYYFGGGLGAGGYDGTASEDQLAQRAKYLAAVAAWNALTSEQKAVYNSEAAGLPLTGYNLFLKRHLNGDI